MTTNSANETVKRILTAEKVILTQRAGVLKGDVEEFQRRLNQVTRDRDSMLAKIADIDTALDRIP